MRRSTRAGVACVLLIGASMTLAGCSSTPSLSGVWSASDGSADKVFNDSGQCSGMYYANGAVLDIGGGETCTLGSEASDGTYPLVVEQSPNQETLSMKFSGSTMVFSSGGKQITLTKQ